MWTCLGFVPSWFFTLIGQVADAGVAHVKVTPIFSAAARFSARVSPLVTPLMSPESDSESWGRNCSENHRGAPPYCSAVNCLKRGGFMFRPPGRARTGSRKIGRAHV